MQPRAIVLDFDGVVLDSVRIKGEAFRALFAEYPEHQDRIEQFHYANGGLSRYAKFAWIYRELLQRELSDAEMALLDLRFSATIADAIRSCPFVAGAREFIEQQSAHLPMFVASGTPEAELVRIVHDRGLSPHFTRVYGSPREKTDALRLIAEELGASHGELLFIGDGRQDYDAAIELGVPFVGVGPSGAMSQFPRAIAVVRDLAELGQRWAQAGRQ